MVTFCSYLCLLIQVTVNKVTVDKKPSERLPYWVLNEFGV